MKFRNAGLRFHPLFAFPQKGMLAQQTAKHLDAKRLTEGQNSMTIIAGLGLSRETQKYSEKILQVGSEAVCVSPSTPGSGRTSAASAFSP